MSSLRLAMQVYVIGIGLKLNSQVKGLRNCVIFGVIRIVGGRFEMVMRHYIRK